MLIRQFMVTALGGDHNKAPSLGSESTEFVIVPPKNYNTDFAYIIAKGVYLQIPWL